MSHVSISSEIFEWGQGGMDGNGERLTLHESLKSLQHQNASETRQERPSITVHHECQYLLMQWRESLEVTNTVQHYQHRIPVAKYLPYMHSYISHKPELDG